MIKGFAVIVRGVSDLVAEWEVKLSGLDEALITQKWNGKHRTIKQITGHMIDSASNNLHRIVHLQYGDSPLFFPNYATNGNNDRWIAIQNYQEENWHLLVQLWKYSNLHIVHVIKQIDASKLNCKWVGSPAEEVSLKDMVMDYLRHLQLHLSEIEGLVKSCKNDK